MPHIYACIFVCVCRCVCVHTHVRGRIYLYIYICTHTHTYMGAHTYMCIHVCAYIQLIVSQDSRKVNQKFCNIFEPSGLHSKPWDVLDPIDSIVVVGALIPCALFRSRIISKQHWWTFNVVLIQEVMFYKFERRKEPKPFIVVKVKVKLISIH